MRASRFDVILAGGSFAGLAVARALRGRRVLLLEPRRIGSVQASACGTLLEVLQATGVMRSLLEVHDSLVIHLGDRGFNLELPYPFCTFDYEVFCQELLTQSTAEVLQATAVGHRDGVVHTTRGELEAKFLIDATGWRAALASNSTVHSQPYGGMSFGLETVIPVVERGLHFYYDPRRHGSHRVGWLFPIGLVARAGLGSYFGETRLDLPLTQLVHTTFGLPTDGRHGGFFPFANGPTSTDHVIRVGDAAGQCLPLTGEGIRPALFFGTHLGRLVSRALEGALTEDEALCQYQKLVARHRAAYRMLLVAQKALPPLPSSALQALAILIRRPQVTGWLFGMYRTALDPRALTCPDADHKAAMAVPPSTATLAPSKRGEPMGPRLRDPWFDQGCPGKWKSG